MSLFGFLGNVIKGGLGIATGGASNVLLGAAGAIVGGSKARQVVSQYPPTFRLPDSTVTRSGVTLPGGGLIGSSKTNYYGPGTGVVKHGGTCLTKSGKPRKMTKSGKCAKRPSMNAANPRALKRAIRRVTGFMHLAREVGFSRPPHAIKGVHHTPAKRRRKAPCR
jgi:hypothetical protein